MEEARKLVRSGLARLGYNITVCSSSVNALESFGENPDRFDIVATDQAMPKLSGIEIAAAIAIGKAARRSS